MILDVIHKLEDGLEKLSVTLSDNLPDYEGYALYLPSSSVKSNFYAVHGRYQNSEKFNVFDRNFWRRYLSREDSIAVEFALGDKDFFVSTSRYFPSEHVCSHIRLGEKGVLQLAFSQTNKAYLQALQSQRYLSAFKKRE